MSLLHTVKICFIQFFTCLARIANSQWLRAVFLKRYVYSVLFQCIVYCLICTDADTFVQFPDERFTVDCNVKSERTKSELKFNLSNAQARDNTVQVHHIGVYSHISDSHTYLFGLRIYGSYRQTLY